MPFPLILVGAAGAATLFGTGAYLATGGQSTTVQPGQVTDPSGLAFALDWKGLAGLALVVAAGAYAFKGGT